MATCSEIITKYGKILQGDCLDHMQEMQPGSVDLVLGSPPYENARTYGIGFDLTGQEWVDWMVKVFLKSLEVCNGLVAFVVEGRTQDYTWSATPALLMADLVRRGVRLRKPPIYHRVGIPGSGGPDWLRNDTEFIVCASQPGRLPWSDPTACGHPPKWAPGGEMSYRLSNGKRRNLWGGTDHSGTNRRKDGSRDSGVRPSHRKCTVKREEGNREQQDYTPPDLANPGNVITCKVGGGHLGSKLASENEAPFPEKLAAFFIKSFCPPGGLVYDPFGGSGTVAAVAIKMNRRFITSEIRSSQVELIQRRIQQAQAQRGFGLCT